MSGDYNTLRDYLSYVSQHGTNGSIPIFQSKVSLTGDHRWHHIFTYIPLVSKGAQVEDLREVEERMRRNESVPSFPLRIQITEGRRRVGKPIEVTQRNHLNDVCLDKKIKNKII